MIMNEWIILICNSNYDRQWDRPSGGNGIAINVYY